MQSARKVTLVLPREGQIGGSLEESEEVGSLSSLVEKPSDKIKTKIFDKIHRFIKVILKLARSVGYDDALRIKLKNGKYLEKSNIVDLLTHAMSVGKVLYGENEFIELLANSQVDPELIINDNVRLKLIQYKNSNKPQSNFDISQPTQITSTQTHRIPIQYIPERIKEIRRGPKKLIVSEENVSQRPRKEIIVVNENGATINLDDDYMDVNDNLKRKRKISDINEDSDDDEDIDDEQIDQTRWKIR